ncbi:hypothetical protein M3Y99_01716700 [Aphelenchoides fujianensis]|nr:hypothetical protein M3Y99_01716700 [Aphelenchoides fujianensis]
MPFDVQHCTMTFGSWTHDNAAIDYFPLDEGGEAIGTDNCIENEGWNIIQTEGKRVLSLRYTLLEFAIHIQRKPLYYLTNLIAPTSIITASTMNDQRPLYRSSLGITTLLSMSILIFMVSDKLPSTSTDVPLIGVFYQSMIVLIAFATLFSTYVINVQKRGINGHRPATTTMRWARRVGKMFGIEQPLLMKQAYALKAKSALSTMMLPGSLGLGRLADGAQLLESFSRTSTMKRPDDLRPPELMNMSIDEEADRMSEEDEDWDSHTPVPSSPFVLNIPNGGHVWPPRLTVDAPRRSPSSVSATPTQPSLSIRRRKPRPNSSIPEVIVDGNPLLSSPTTQQRNLAEIEYDFLAAVVERLFLVLFLVLFLDLLSRNQFDR